MDEPSNERAETAAVGRLALAFIVVCVVVALLVLLDLNREIRRARREVNRARAGLGPESDAGHDRGSAGHSVPAMGYVDSNGAGTDAAGMAAEDHTIVRPGDESARPPRRGGIHGPGGIDWAG